MFTDKKDLVKQVNWALRVYQPLGVIQVSDASAKWTPEGYEIRFEGGSAMIAHFAGRIVALAWQSMGDVARYQFAKDCDELLHRVVKELGHFDIGYLESLFHLLKECDGDRRILMGQDVQFNNVTLRDVLLYCYRKSPHRFCADEDSFSSIVSCYLSLKDLMMPGSIPSYTSALSCG